MPQTDDRFDFHMKYELWMLGETFKRLKDFREPASDPIETNSLIESFCIHARSMIEFFHKSDAKDRRAREYTRDGYEPFKGVEAQR